jgi:hypothetical protein
MWHVVVTVLCGQGRHASCRYLPQLGNKLQRGECFSVVISIPHILLSEKFSSVDTCMLLLTLCVDMCVAPRSG